MSINTRRLLLANGEEYIHPIEPQSSGGPATLPRSYEEARERVKAEIKGAMERLAELPEVKRLSDESVLCLRLHPDRMAKTYEPKAIFQTVGELENIGSRYYKAPAKRVGQTDRIKKQIQEGIEMATGRLIFVRGNEHGFKKLLHLLDKSAKDLSGQFCADIQSIERFDLLSKGEQLSFPRSWTEGRVELVIHPTRCSEMEQTSFLGTLFDREQHERMLVRRYPGGPTFISCYLHESALELLNGTNPLRFAHPLNFTSFEELRSTPKLTAPSPPVDSKRSTIRVGMFDGGVDVNHPHLCDFIEQDENLGIKTPESAHCVAHGTAVAGALLYGPLNDQKGKDQLTSPPVSIVSVRALPPSSQTDPDLYECIDIVEEAVPARDDVKIWNISFGPRGPILDDAISRFTYALDSLAMERKVTFTVAAGNDGEIEGELGRVQSPADLVNGLGVGAHTIQNGLNVRADYSCRGPGRECGKVKPDVTAFGGCELNQIHLLSINHGQKVLSQGTSFAAPQVASLAGQALGSIDRATPLLTRVLLVHTAKHPNLKPDNFLGHGAIAASVTEMTQCDTNDVSIVFQRSIMAGKHLMLPIMLPEDLITDGFVTVSWTIACLPPVNALHPADYTSICIEDTFYPDSRVHRYSPPRPLKDKPKELHQVQDSREIAALLASGWKPSQRPVTHSPKYRTEDQRRTAEQKWEPLVKRIERKRADSLFNPFLVLHAIARRGVAERLDFAAIIRVSAPKFTGDLYTAIQRRYPALQPVRIRSEAEIRIQVPNKA